MLVSLIAVMASAQGTSQSTSTKGTPEVATQKLSGKVVQVEGSQLLVKLSSGEVRVFTPPSDQKFVIDGKEVGLSQLQPGTTLHATYTETKTPITDRTVQTISGRVWYVAPPNVVLTLPSGENRQFVVKDTYKFHDPDGRDMTVFDLRPGMNVSAEKVTEAPRVELVTTRAVTGTAPAPAPAAPAAAAPHPAPPQPASTAGHTAPAAAAPPAHAAPPAPAHTAAPPPRLPKTGSNVPLIGLLGLFALLVSGASYGIRRYLV
jgi:LPXTG-motif cell wall-anchored protein